MVVNHQAESWLSRNGFCTLVMNRGPVPRYKQAVWLSVKCGSAMAVQQLLHGSFGGANTVFCSRLGDTMYLHEHKNIN